MKSKTYAVKESLLGTASEYIIMTSSLRHDCEAKNQHT